MRGQGRDLLELIDMANAYAYEIARQRKLPRLHELRLILVPRVKPPAHLTLLGDVLHLEWPAPDQP